MTTKEEIEISTISNAAMARPLVEQSTPVRAIFWPFAEDIDKMSKSLNEILEQPKRFSEQQEGTRQEEASLLGNTRRRDYGADFRACDWEDYYLRQIEEMKGNERNVDVYDKSQQCRDFCSVLQTKQMLWNDLLNLKELKDDAEKVKSAFADFKASNVELRLARCLEWRARRAVEGEIAWRKSVDATVEDILAGPTLSVLSRELVESFTSRSPSVDLNFFRSLHEALMSALLRYDDCDTCPKSFPVESIGSVDVDEQILLLISDISLLMEIVRKSVEASELEAKILAYLEAKHPFVCGPMGESPIHTCFLLGLKEFGYKVIERFYTTPEAISVGYKSDLELWKGPSKLESGWEDGLYTGETCLHMAIVQEDMPLVEYLLDRHISLLTRARGLFFQPRLIRQRIVGLDIWRLLSERWGAVRAERSSRRVSFTQMLELRFEGGEEQYFTGWELLKAWAFGLVFKSHLPGVTSLNFINRYSSCYYGEYPLSFAASVGSTVAASMLYNYQKVRAAARRPMAAFERREWDLQRARLDGWVAAAPATDAAAPADTALFVNAMDAFGNTALHMAVLHRRRDMIDWLAGTPEGRAGLEILNHDGLTPFTLAARLGEAGIFHHMLNTHLSETMWAFGKVLPPPRTAAWRPPARPPPPARVSCAPELRAGRAAEGARPPHPCAHARRALLD